MSRLFPPIILKVIQSVLLTSNQSTQLVWDFWDMTLPHSQNNSSSAVDSCENRLLLS